VQLEAICEWGAIPSENRHAGPDSAANADCTSSKDVVVMPINAFLLAEHLPNAQLITYSDASHAAQSKHADVFWSMLGYFWTAELSAGPCTGKPI
jgi:hypothetical protein